MISLQTTKAFSSNLAVQAAVVGVATKAVGSVYRVNDVRHAAPEARHYTQAREATGLSLAMVLCSLVQAGLAKAPKLMSHPGIKPYEALVHGAGTVLALSISEKIARLVAHKTLPSHSELKLTASENKPSGAAKVAAVVLGVLGIGSAVSGKASSFSLPAAQSAAQQKGATFLQQVNGPKVMQAATEILRRSPAILPFSSNQAVINPLHFSNNAAMVHSVSTGKTSNRWLA